MSIEKEVFKRCKIDFEKLLSYGFSNENGDYIYSKNIMNDNFRVDIIVTKDGRIAGTVLDLSLYEEYTNFRIESLVGEFVAKVREEFENILWDIKNSCTTTEYFLSGQANRISHLIIQKYDDKPEFLWKKYPGYGIYRNTSNEKWYALIMNISIGKISQGDYEVEIINVKLNEEKIKKLLKQKGFYQAYHMNKKNWISIILDNTLSDDEIMSYIEESHRFTEMTDR
ncbi:MmcQ/YjbR family DNA-binding protein [Lachnoclostridium sp. An181]|uniref:MmcQ/YjbR family DNA-binding protein n=1 Tax=Lachnoclostridium sp. An181 TaxID=1965575 RepID=UPI000B388E18|nr:MmcQ/YjbR family DNA-binding protein [Lachnoclostridium sp. An181]OUP50546.1 hypothetical protein B5F18_02570 [Lachnoclostridium sp. An181]